MKKLITDNPQSNTETMLNYAYVEDKWVKIRGMEKPFMQYIREQCQHQGCNLSELDDMETAENVTDCAFSNPECPIFMLFTTATQAAELRGRLKEYENTGLTPQEAIDLKKKELLWMLLMMV